MGRTVGGGMRAALGVACALLSASFARAQEWSVPEPVEALFARHCLACHDEQGREAGVSLERLPQLALSERLALLNRVQEVLHFASMPPPERRRQPTDEQRALLAAWVAQELDAHQASQLADKLRLPEAGNLVDHEALFSGAHTGPAFTPARRWMVSPQIFTERVLDVFELEGREREQWRQRGFYGVTNGFVLPERSGVRDYDTARLDGGHLLVMLSNAEWVSTKQLMAARIEAGELSAQDLPNPRDRWYPRRTPAAFAAIVLGAQAPGEEALAAAVQEQFRLVLRRPATAQELARYVGLARESIELAGPSEGLRQMLVAVLLESEFVYRLEFGAGEEDEHGRRMLSPRELSFALAYALGDRGPDPALVEAAASGRLSTREDVRREVERLLDEPNWFRAEIDSSLNGKQTRSLATSHPKLVRFFREFFGYPAAIRVFKDLIRSNGYYKNPDRNDTQTPGQLISEADRLVEWVLGRDERVFEELLGTRRFFVAPVEGAGEKIDQLERLYAHFADTNWREDPEGVATAPENLPLVQEVLHPRAHGRHLAIAMRHIERFREAGVHPHPVWDYPFERLLTTWAASYDIDSFAWAYPRSQPFALPDRRGLLTHPAWLIAHSANTATDPVRRGRWIREKLLAGSVPDIPITVDAQVPELPDLSLRQRLASVTEVEDCWSCHQHMNPLGYPFEMYDDFGRSRSEESLEHPENFLAHSSAHNGADLFETVPVDARGALVGTGDPELDGEVVDALDLIDRLVRSDRVRQSILRHAFRFFLGRNEQLSDSPTLRAAERAYLASGGSFRAVVVSLLTSDSFLYRKATTP